MQGLLRPAVVVLINGAGLLVVLINRAGLMVVLINGQGHRVYMIYIAERRDRGGEVPSRVSSTGASIIRTVEDNWIKSLPS